MAFVIQILAIWQQSASRAVLGYFIRSIKNGFRRARNFSGHRRKLSNHGLDSCHHCCAWRNSWLSSVQALCEVIQFRRWVAGLLAVVLLPIFCIQPAYAITINTAQINGKYYGLTGALNNPAVGVAVDMGTALITKANPWITGIGLGFSIYKIAEELFPGQVVAFRPGLVSESVPSWPNNQPPSSYAATAPNDGYQYLIQYESTSVPRLSTPEAALLDYYSRRSTPCSAGTKSTAIPAAWINTVATAGGCSSAQLPLSSWAAPLTCQSGYTLSGSTCNLTNASLVKYPSDGIPTYISDGAGHFIPDPRDPDIPSSSLSGLNGQPSVTQSTGGGQQTSTTSVGSDGSISHSTTNNYYDSTDNQYHSYTQNTTINNSGAVTGFSTTNNIVQAQNGQYTPVTPSAQNINFPTDYNREATQQQIKAQGDDVAADRTAANATKAALNLPTAPTYAQADLHIPNQSAFQVAPTDAFGQLFPHNGGSCVTLPVDLPYLHTLNIDPCPIVTAARPIIDWAIVVLGIISGVFILLGKSSDDT